MPTASLGSLGLHHRHGARRTASATPSSRARVLSAPRGLSSVGIPATIALSYCLYAAFVAGDNGWSTGLTWLIALVSAGVLGVVCFAVGRWQSGRQPESIAVVYGMVFGIAMGYLLSLNDWSILKSCGVGLLLAASMAVSVFYIAHTHQRWTGRRRGSGSSEGRRTTSHPGR
jgi:uncharacterized membrane protein